ncbi:DUF5689 domain-containing protein [Ferruginibacter sp. HRS2-29]|uniref:DUF5689 domain-containing protein n=1 Tax=Ferruginibacter sp. HRS2-29 TaxID=2487334 RepID=UPI0020CE8B46|nr:DUF5689 domain-containing protein [Ferruginibacter sp. HRS2-29]MCP9750863.1 hypothetical protein [Ferruginibacter sp. HRS2-29]
MNNFLKSSFAAIAIMISALTFTSCEKDFDNPPLYEEPNIVPNKTIAALKAMHISGQVETITDDIIIAGVVNADDKSGNYYKQISIQDSTGGITIRLDGNNLYTSYPVGRKVYIKLKGLYMGDYNSLIQIGGSIDNSGSFLNVLAIPSALFDKYIVKGSVGYTVTPKVVTVAELNASYQSMLIQINNAEFLPSDTAKTYADAVLQQSVNLNAQACTGSSIIVRTSGFSTFAGVNAPNGNGTLTAIYTTFGSTKQLIIRDTNDVQFKGTRCNGSTPGGGGAVDPNPARITLAAFRALQPGTADVTVPTNTHFTAKVISNNANEAAGNYRLQDESGAGIILYTVVGSPVYPIGTVLNVNAGGGGIITLFNGDKELKSVPIANITTSTLAMNLTPRVATIAEILTNKNTWASSLVKINNLTSIVAGTSNSTGTNYTVTDATGTLKMFVRTAAGITVSTSGTSITGYVSIFNTDTQVGIRSASDIQ